jgi:UDP-N-acetylglucosamine 4-epimerase
METIRRLLENKSYTWLVTGAAGFIGSHLSEQLLRAGQRVVGLDNFSAGKPENIDYLLEGVAAEQRSNFTFIEGDIADAAVTRCATGGVDYVLHQAAMGSVPKSIDDPQEAHASNVTGFVNIVEAARNSDVKRVVYASSCAIYGDTEELPISESVSPSPLSPYAATKWADEIYAKTFGRTYGLETVGLRYFNIYGPRQDPDGAYAAVIPRWIQSLGRGERVRIFGDGENTRDFCYVLDVVQANLKAALTGNQGAMGRVFNIASGRSISLNSLLKIISDEVENIADISIGTPIHEDFRKGDIRHSAASIDLAKQQLEYVPDYSLEEGIRKTTEWFLR